MRKVPLQVYLDARDRKLLDELVARHGLSMAETVRTAIRRWAIEETREDDPVLGLVGTIDSPELPPDLSTRHDEIAVLGVPPRQPRGQERRDGTVG